LFSALTRLPKPSRSAVLRFVASMLLMQRQRLPDLVSICRISARGWWTPQ
jgi:hypothetical protein